MTQESPYRWVIVALGALLGCVALGAMFSLAVFLAPGMAVGAVMFALLFPKPNPVGTPKAA